jgi:predicted dehydrogenase
MALTRRVVVIGAGSIGRRHARLLSERPDVALEICDTDPAGMQRAISELRQPPAKTYTDWRAAIAAKPDVVLIATPHQFHAEQSVAALDAGIHVLCEKPMADSVAAARRMVEAGQRNQRVLSIGFHMHFVPGLQRVRALIAEGRLGAIGHIHAHVGTYVTLVNSASRFQANLPGALLMDYAHQPDLFQWWLGRRPARVFVAGTQSGNLELTSNPNVVAMTMLYDDAPTLGTIHLNYLQMPEQCFFSVMGDRAWAHFNFITGQLQLGDRETKQLETETFTWQRDDIYRAEHQAFFEALAGQREVESPATEAIIATEIIESGLQSWRTGQIVSLG